MSDCEEVTAPSRIRSKQLKAGKLRILAPAKLNLFLELVSRRADGYHDLSTVMQTVDLFDELALSRAESGVELVTTGLDVPQGRQNIVWRAADLFLERFAPGMGVRIALAKRIPAGSGLGGGSSDAASTLVGLNRLLGLRLGSAELQRLAAVLGSDVPFFIEGGTALCQGRGDVVTSVKSASRLHYVIVCPYAKVSTRDVYARSKIALTGPRREANILLAALEKGDIGEIGKEVFNRLELISVAIHPPLLELEETMAGMPFAGVGMTGSGSAFFGICRSRRGATAAAASLTNAAVGGVFSATSWP